jgi:hypothetical protein
MTKSALIVVAAALLLGGTSLASAKNKGAAGAHSKQLPCNLITQFLGQIDAGYSPMPL